jgi:FkbM family methyltransferase
MFKIAQLYAHIYVIIKSLTGLNIPGLGFLLRLCKRPRYINFLKQKLYFEPAVASSYGLFIINRVQEPETHSILNHIYQSFTSQKSVFIEVGANIGAIMVDIARHDDVHVFGFEPSMNCVTAITKTMAYNQRNNFNIFQNLVGEDEAMVAFSEGKADGSASIYTSTNSSEKVQQIKLDSVKELSALPEGMPTVIMIDVEGYEPNVLRGGAELIKRLKPLVLFEYNYVSKRYFNINEIHQILGDSYIIFRLRNDALLDSVVANAWNCVAIPRNTQFETILKSRITS